MSFPYHLTMKQLQSTDLKFNLDYVHKNARNHFSIHK